MNFQPKSLLAFLAFAIFATCAQRPLWGDTFRLHQGGSVEGSASQAPSDDSPVVVILTSDGGRIALERDQIASADIESDHLAQYRKTASGYADTVEGQWNLAQWCFEHHLTEQRQTHLRQIIQIDPDHVRARALLGYAFLDGNWVTQSEWYEDHGFISYQGQWRTRQEIELLEEKSEYDEAVKQWKRTLRRWRITLERQRSLESRDRILAINDPAALPALTEMIEEEQYQGVRLLYLAALNEIGTVEAYELLMQLSMHDLDEEIRLSSLEWIVETHPPQATGFYVDLLRDGDNNKINRAAYALQSLDDPTAVEPLIAALVTTHRLVIDNGAGEAITTTFSSDGTSFSSGQQQRVLTRTFSNHAVLQALVGLTGVNHGYQHHRWRSWLAARRASGTPLHNARRDG